MEYWTEEDLRALQNFLLLSPDSWRFRNTKDPLVGAGRGKRGGARVIYYWHVPQHRIYLIYGYVKSERENLTPQQITVLAELMKDVKDG
jgi:mRNA-degrading endonuclease RelE of RelBE toxin-antitoxin system